MVEPLHDIHMAAARAWNTLPLDVRAAPSLAAGLEHPAIGR